MLLLGSLEEVHTITAEMVETTANELSDDLGAGGVALAQAENGPYMQPGAVPPPPPPPNPATIPSQELDTLAGRILALEQGAMRQERMLKRMLDIMEAKVPQ